MIDPDIQQRAARIRLLALDVDGTLTDGQLWFSDDGIQYKAFSAHDGLGLKLLRQHGIEAAIITARTSPVVEVRARDLGITHVYQGSRDKRASLLDLCGKLNLDPLDAAMMGDDLSDLPAMRICGLAAAPANAHPWMDGRVHWKGERSGGFGAVRELCDLLLSAQGKVDFILDSYWPAP